MLRKIVPDDHQTSIRHFLSVFKKFIKPAGVIHVGAHEGEEVDAYLEFGFNKIILIEANPRWVELLRRQYSRRQEILVLHYAVSNQNGQALLNINTSRKGNDEPSSILGLKKLKEIYKYVKTEESIAVPSRRLDDVPELQKLSPGACNFLNIDVQGAELLAFQGAPRWLHSMDAVLTEVNLLELYEGCAMEDEVISVMAEYGFQAVESLYHELYNENSKFPAWGESLFIKKNLIKAPAEP